MPELIFTQYLRPLGRTQPIKIPISPEQDAVAEVALKAGYRFEAEILTTGQVSLTITGKNTDVYIEIVQNNVAEVTIAVAKLLSDFDLETAKQRDDSCA